MNELQGKRALVTGASSGIGAASARALTAAGAEVLLCARRLERLEALASELPGSECLSLDVRDSAAVQAALGERSFDLVIANAGLARNSLPIHSGSADDWDQMLDTNVKGLANVARWTLPGMIERGSGDLVLLGSVAGRQVYPGGSMYCASKHAVRALYESFRLDAAGSGVRFTSVDPGMVETEFSNVRFYGDEAAASKVYEGFDALQAEDVADAILYAVTRPKHVNIGEIVIWPSAQASTTSVKRE